jgi:hypothetical protein
MVSYVRIYAYVFSLEIEVEFLFGKKRLYFSTDVNIGFMWFAFVLSELLLLL